MQSKYEPNPSDQAEAERLAKELASQCHWTYNTAVKKITAVLLAALQSARDEAYRKGYVDGVKAQKCGAVVGVREGEALRRTGRTTRMVQHAIGLSQSGKAVYIIAGNRAEQYRIEHLLPEHLRSVIKVETPDTPGNFSWEHMRLIGAHPNCAVLADHYAIECRFAKMLGELHAYDE